MKRIPTPLPELFLLEPNAFGDQRGFFLESYNREKHGAAGIDATFVQDNHSRSQANVLRGLHFQRYQGKLVTVMRGAVYDVAVDIRPDSPRFGQWFGSELNDENHHQLYIPPGFAHGFAVLSDTVDVLYKTTDFYRPEQEGGILWNDSTIGVQWPLENPILSERDQKSPLLAEIPQEELVTQAELDEYFSG